MRKDAPITALPKVDPSWRIAIVTSSFYVEEMEMLVEGAKRALTEAGIDPVNIVIHRAPGSFEVPLIGEAIARAGTADALIGLGIIVEGETHHADLLARESARGIMDVQLRHRLPFAFEILYVDSLELARRRLDKGIEAAHAVLHSLAALREIVTE